MSTERKEDKDREIKIVTHDGRFHLDDVLACHILTTIYKNAYVVRTRDADIINSGVYVFDVGGEYAPEKGRFDHHQRGFDIPFDSSISDIKMSSAGMVYKHFGKEYLRLQEKSEELSSEELDEIYERIYCEYILSVDAEDNGVDPAENCKYKARTIGDSVNDMNPRSMPQSLSREKQDKIRHNAFMEAVQWVGDEFKRSCQSFIAEQKATREVLDPKNHKIFGNGDEGRFIVFSVLGASRQIVQNYNRRTKKNILLYLSPHYSNTENIKSMKYSITSVNKENCAFSPLCPLPVAWRGYRSDHFMKSEIIEEHDIFFVHASGFFGIGDNLECSKYMAEEAIKEFNGKR
ncbi:hypothetical protein NEFER01_0237 [Nematocida sp. LUAm1]|nr:hypothetical protein NEFER01_0237 [Nematocida sp. LUAm1]